MRPRIAVIVLSAAQSSSLQGRLATTAAGRSSHSVWWPSRPGLSRFGCEPLRWITTASPPSKLTKPFVPWAWWLKFDQQPGCCRLADPEADGAPPVLTGHADGVITLNVAEADEVERERRRLRLHEPYRTAPSWAIFVTRSATTTGSD